MKQIDPAAGCITSFGLASEFVDSVKPGEVFSVRTKDCFGNKLQRPEQVLSDLPWDSVNPCTGPIFVQGAVAGDVMAVEILDISLDDHGVIIQDAGDLQRMGYENAERSMHVAVAGGEMLLPDGYALPVRPMVGVMGVAAKEPTLTTLPGVHGGNMDCNMVREGSILLLPVFQEGAGLALGDLHASMGDGETTGCGIEISGTVKLRVSLLKESDFPLPVVIREDMVVTIASDYSLDGAVDRAAKNMFNLLTGAVGIEPDTAWAIMTACADMKVCQIANKLKTARCELPKSVFGQWNPVNAFDMEQMRACD